MLLKVSQISQENTCVGVFFYKKPPGDYFSISRHCCIFIPHENVRKAFSTSKIIFHFSLELINRFVNSSLLITESTLLVFTFFILQTAYCTENEVFVEDFFSKCNQTHQIRIWSNLLKKSLMENFIFSTVPCLVRTFKSYICNITHEAIKETYRVRAIVSGLSVSYITSCLNVDPTFSFQAQQPGF